MKKLLLLALTFILFICGCGSTSAASTNYDASIVELGIQQLNEYGHLPNRTYSVEYNTETNLYEVDINGTELLFAVPPEPTDEKILVDTGDALSKKQTKLLDRSKEYIYSYVDASEILENKSEIKDFISSIPAYIADIPYPGLYLNGKIFIGTSYTDYLSEWTIVHELVHALCEFTSGGVENQRYFGSIFDEVITDVITASMNPKNVKNAESFYSIYYQHIYAYIGCFGTEAIKAYFYGYDSILETIGNEHELDFFRFSLDNLFSNQYALVCINNSVNHWQECDSDNY